ARTGLGALSLHDALPIYLDWGSAAAPPNAPRRERAREREKTMTRRSGGARCFAAVLIGVLALTTAGGSFIAPRGAEGQGKEFKRSEEHTSELQSRFDIVC